eukprot:TRINITY_DN18111_c0_g1_i2.p1 TRINITY_DN18111_c0_g1~~TRINITY_DN18111_c0_g1_i2.p1  ORF type:complete len:191 (+),score=44.86 TRINITY_DN18111_c0_g1_i2:310-882(+)
MERRVTGGGLEACDGGITVGFHTLGDHYGNRSPRADPSLRGMESGLSMHRSLDELAVRYLSAIQAVAYGARHIIETLTGAGYHLETITMCGGGTKNAIFIREHANVCGRPVVLSKEPEAVLLGGAVLAGAACGMYGSVEAAMEAMCGAGEVVNPDPATSAFHQAKYRVWLEMYEDQIKYRRIMESQSSTG